MHIGFQILWVNIKGHSFWIICCSVTQLCPTLCDPMDCSTPGFPVLHQLQELAQTYVYWVSEAIQPSHPVIPFSSSLQSFPASGSFPLRRNFESGGQSIGVSASVSIPSMHIQDWFPSELTDLLSLLSKGLSRVFSNTKLKHISSLVVSLIYGPTLTSMHDNWKNHRFDYMDFVAFIGNVMS